MSAINLLDYLQDLLPFLGLQLVHHKLLNAVPIVADSPNTY